jgi:diguanylate cyclase (GGDEF)-like protein
VLSSMIVDLDHFKHINDRAGHAAGDQVLHRFAEGMTRTLRSIDIVGRIGGEEFALLLPGTPLAGAMLTADRIRGTARSVVMPHAVGLPALTISVGVAELHPGDASSDAMLGRADAAMYRAKRGGRDRSIAADPPDAIARDAIG